MNFLLNNCYKKISICLRFFPAKGFTFFQIINKRQMKRREEKVSFFKQQVTGKNLHETKFLFSRSFRFKKKQLFLLSKKQKGLFYMCCQRMSSKILITLLCVFNVIFHAIGFFVNLLHKFKNSMPFLPLTLAIS